jgi:hypothetical protein
MPLTNPSNPSHTTEKARVLEVWLDGLFHGAIRVNRSSLAARAILKFFDPGRKAEFRDPMNHETYRYDHATNSVISVDRFLSD